MGVLSIMEILNKRVLWGLGEAQCAGMWVAFHTDGSSTVCLPGSLWVSAAGNCVLDWLGARWFGMDVPTMVTQLLYRKSIA